MLAIGLMSGTSMDGIDAALLETDGEAALVEKGNIYLPYEASFTTLLKALEKSIHSQQALAEILPYYLQHDLQWPPSQVAVFLKEFGHFSYEMIESLSTQLHAQAVRQLLAKTNTSAELVQVIGYHGQTLKHNPAIHQTLQMGEGALLAKLTGIPVINRFRDQDMALGGQGAPFAPLFHQALARRDHKMPVAVVNCGGIANITLISGPHLTEVMGFDTGPGNVLLDRLVKQQTKGRLLMDINGEYGRDGKVNEAILEQLYEKTWLGHAKHFLKKAPPKSLDSHDLALIPELTALSLPDACRTLAVFTAETIVQSLKVVNDYSPPKYWVLAGGGWKNPVITLEFKQRLAKQLGNDLLIETADEAGWNSQALEAQMFAYFAVRSLLKLPLSVPGTTGVQYPVTGGTLYYP